MDDRSPGALPQPGKAKIRPEPSTYFNVTETPK